jgi:hypothetical protein
LQKQLSSGIRRRNKEENRQSRKANTKLLVGAVKLRKVIRKLYNTS